MKTILVPISSFENGETPLSYAIEFASEINAKIYVVKTYGYSSVVSSLKSVGPILEKEAKKELKVLLKSMDTKNVEIVATVVKGTLAENIVAIRKTIPIDLIVSVSNRISKDETIYIGKITGHIIKHVDCPILVIPLSYKYKPIHAVLMAIKSGIIKREHVLDPIVDLLAAFKAKLNLLQVITPRLTEEDLVIREDLVELAASFQSSENATVYQGVLEHLIENNPDVLCIIRRKRGFFSKLWEHDEIYKVDLESRIPLLILRGAF